jgi:hypothetical protein
MNFIMKFFAFFIIFSLGVSARNHVDANSFKPSAVKYYYQSNHKLQESVSVVRSLFGNNFGVVPVPRLLTRKLASYGPYYATRRIQTINGHNMGYYYGK